MARMRNAVVSLGLGVSLAVGCAKPMPRVEAPAPEPAPVPAPPPSTPVRATPPPAPPQRVDDSVPRTPALPPEERVTARTLEDLNRNSPLRPVFFELDSQELNETGRQVVAANAEVMKRNPSWAVTVEGHCDDRGTAEYNLALGERRATVVRDYLVSLGIATTRLRTVSYGEEFPFDASETEAAWAQNRRAHFVITSQ